MGEIIIMQCMEVVAWTGTRNKNVTRKQIESDLAQIFGWLCLSGDRYLIKQEICFGLWKPRLGRMQPMLGD